MTPLVFDLTGRALLQRSTRRKRAERLHRRAKQAPLTNIINSVAKYEEAQCKVVHKNRQRFEMPDKADVGLPETQHRARLVDSGNTRRSLCQTLIVSRNFWVLPKTTRHRAQHVLHARNVFVIHLRNAPHVLAPRLEVIFRQASPNRLVLLCSVSLTIPPNTSQPPRCASTPSRRNGSIVSSTASRLNSVCQEPPHSRRGRSRGACFCVAHPWSSIISQP
jgi:hypothetical protein